MRRNREGNAVSDAWMPEAGRIRGAIDGGPLKGGAPRAVWQVLGADPRSVSARSAAQRLVQLGRACHLVWNPIHGEVVQLIPILRAGRSLGWPDGPNQMSPLRPDAGTLAGPMQRGAAAGTANGAGEVIAEVNTEGRVCVQICVVAFAWEPFTLLPMRGHHQIVDWLDSWGVCRRWPAGQPAPFPLGHSTCRDRRLWAKGGHFGASQVPDLTDTGPGALDVDLLIRGPRRAAARTARVAADALGDGVLATASEVRKLDDYFDEDAAALSRAG
jgi:hypothetical protein